MIVYYQLLLSIVNMGRCDHFILLRLYNIIIFCNNHYLFVIVFINIIYIYIYFERETAFIHL